MRTAALLLVGGLLVTLELALRGAHDLATHVAGQATAFALFLPAAWLVWRGLGIGAAGVTIVVLVAVMLRAAAFVPEPPLSTDLYRYAWDARVTASGTSPYLHAPTDEALEPLRDVAIWPEINLPTWQTPYPPGAQAAFLAARVAFGGGPRATTWLFLTAESATVALLVLVLVRLGRPPERVLLYAWHPLAVSEIASNGHVDALAALAVASVFAAWTARRTVVAGAVIGAAAIVKYGPALLVPALFRRGGMRLAAPAVAVVAAGYAVAFWAGGDVLGSAPRLLRTIEFGSLEPILAPHLGRPLAQGLLVAALLIVLAVVARRRHDDVDEVARSSLLVLGGLLVTGTFLQPWYALWLVPCLVVVAAPAWLWLSGTLPLLYLNGPDDMLPGWVPWVIYGPCLAWTTWRTVAIAAERRSHNRLRIVSE